MELLWHIALVPIVIASMAGVDYAHARYTHAIREAQTGVPGMRWQAVKWTVLQAAAASIGFMAAVGVSLWYLPAEVAGLAIGTFLGSREFPRKPGRLAAG